MGHLLEHILNETRLLGCDAAVDRLFDLRCSALAADAGVELTDETVAILEHQCRDHIATVARDFENDALELATTFGGAPRNGVCVLDVGLGDAHDGGRSPVLLGTDDGVRFVYKPRSVGGHSVFADVIAAVAVVGESPALRSLSVLDRGDHGWVEYIEPSGCASAEEVAAYHTRFGILLGIAHAFGSVDLHYGNVIAHGATPIVVDWETIFQPALQSEGRPGEAMILRSSVLGTSLLPMQSPGPAGLLDESALGGPHASASRCRLGAKLQSPGLWTDEIVEGFEYMRRAVVDAAEALCAPGGVLDRAYNLPVRFVIRRTAAYRRLLGAGLTLGAMSTSERESWYRSKLTVAGAEPADVAAAIADEEARALARFDIPRFVVEAGSSDLRLGGHIFTSAFPRSTIEQTRDRLSRSASASGERQRRIIRLSVAAHATNAAAARCTGSQTTAAEDTTRDRPAQHDLTAEVETIISTIVDAYEPDVGWMTIRQVAAGRFDVRPASASFADGTLGLACFLVGAASGLPESKLASSCRAIAATAVEQLGMAIDGTNRPNSAALDSGTRPLTAYGAALYGQSGDPEWLQRSRALTSVDDLGPTLDVHAGSAGMLLALAAQPAATRRLVEAADRLIERSRTESHPGQGLAHGVAGMAMALARVANTTGIQRFARSAERLLSELPVAPATDAWAGTWCRGDAGMILARVSIGADLGTRPDDATIARLAEALCERPLAALDHLCCGELGTIEAITTAGDRLDREDLRVAGRERLEDVLRRRDNRGGWSLLPGAPGNEPLGMLQGLAGLGYGLLRHVVPATPSVLTVRAC